MREETMGKEQNKKGKQRGAGASLTCTTWWRFVIMYRVVIITRSCQAIGDDVECTGWTQVHAFSSRLISARRFHLVIAINMVAITTTSFPASLWEFRLISGAFNDIYAYGCRKQVNVRDSLTHRAVLILIWNERVYTCRVGQADESFLLFEILIHISLF